MRSTGRRPIDVEQWIGQAQAGDPVAFNHLVDAHERLIYHIALHHSAGNPDDARDSCQEAMMSAWQAVPRFVGNGDAFRAWLVRIVINACRDRMRYENRRPRRSIEIERDGESRPLPLPDPAESPEAYAMRSDLAGFLGRALDQLSDEHRTVILLDHAGFDYAEMADIVGVEIGTIKSRLSRARERMRRLLTSGPNTGASEPDAGEQRSPDGRGPLAAPSPRPAALDEGPRDSAL